MDDILLQDALSLACQKIAEMSTCPSDIDDYDMDCEKRCECGIEAQCWKQYFLDLAKNS